MTTPEMPADTPDMVLVPLDQLNTLKRSITLDNLLPGEGEALIECWIRAALSASPLGASGEGALRPASRSSVPTEGYHNAVLELQEQIDRAEADWNSTVTIQGWAAREIAAALSAPSTTSTAEQVGMTTEGRNAPNPPGGGEAPVEGRRFVIYWLDKGPVARAFVDDLNGYITGGSGRCLEALEAQGAMVFQKVADLSRPTPATPEGLRDRLQSAIAQADVDYVAENGIPESSAEQVEWAYALADSILSALQPQAQPGTCDVPPEGWVCTRQRGHEGPCAAHPTSGRAGK